MSLFELIIFLLLSVAGFTFTLVHGEIMDILKIRPLLQRFNFTRKVIKCSLCSGVWVGLITATVFLPVVYIIPFAFAGSATAFLFERVTYLIDELIIGIETKKGKAAIVAMKVG